ncbi:hypothetical protein [Amycolatopsis saalfeldensis]|uniref:Uncharacterized protein n=1 Tax=Amycolatopsis saalfeldensis TaxID=394193 RepID=A0A1H8UIX7_9PSEU|nr:hypothetical protein [Amycolatopsis saalfeldensis]SEP03046.1 hypothetical protein SAMN04489732_103303 [Amycolatopsis saalfeldensis]
MMTTSENEEHPMPGKAMHQARSNERASLCDELCPLCALATPGSPP